MSWHARAHSQHYSQKPEGGRNPSDYRWMDGWMNGMWALWSEVCVRPCPPFISWNPKAGSDGVRRWGLWEVLRSGGWNLHEGD